MLYCALFWDWKDDVEVAVLVVCDLGGGTIVLGWFWIAGAGGGGGCCGEVLGCVCAICWFLYVILWRFGFCSSGYSHKEQCRIGPGKRVSTKLVNEKVDCNVARPSYGVDCFCFRKFS